MEDLPLPCGVAINSMVEIIVAELKDNIIKYDKNRRKQVLVDESEIPLEAMCDVAMISDDNIYVVDYETARILKCNLQDLEEDVTCAVCQEHYTEPKVLPCLHYYCKKVRPQFSLQERHQPAIFLSRVSQGDHSS